MSNQNDSSNKNAEDNDDVIYRTASSWPQFWKRIYISDRTNKKERLTANSEKEDIFLIDLKLAYYQNRNVESKAYQSFLNLFQNSYLRFAFLFFILAGAGFSLLYKKNELEIKISGNEVFRKNNNAKSQLGDNDVIRMNDEIQVAKDSSLFLRINDKSSIVFIGPTDFSVKQLDKENLYIALEDGVILYRSTSGETILRITFSTPYSTYHPTGTFAKLTLNNIKEILEIESGNFKIEDKKTGREFKAEAGNSLFTDLTSKTKARNYSALTKQSMENLKAIEKSIESKNLKEIQESHFRDTSPKPLTVTYKKLVTLITKDGKNLTGYLLQDVDNKLILETLTGKIEIDKSNVSSIE